MHNRTRKGGGETKWPEKDERQSGVDYRIRFFTHKGKEILLVDLSNCTPAEVEQISRKVPDYVTTKPPKSVLLLADFAGASLDQNTVWTMKESAVFDKPHINKTAWVGAEKFPEELKNELTKFARREFPIFKSREEALEWLVS